MVNPDKIKYYYYNMDKPQINFSIPKKFFFALLSLVCEFFNRIGGTDNLF